jgi:hypothetical protein
MTGYCMRRNIEFAAMALCASTWKTPSNVDELIVDIVQGCPRIVSLKSVTATRTIIRVVFKTLNVASKGDTYEEPTVELRNPVDALCDR